MKIICVGRNYAAHAKELNHSVEEDPIIFIKPDTCLIRDNEPFYLPDFSDDIHFETEVVYRVSKNGKHISEGFAHRYVDAITTGIDFTARDLQSKLKAKGLPWTLSKCFDGAAPIGKWLDINPENVFSPVEFSMQINDNIRQKGSTADMVFSVPKLISFISTFITLRKGDLIFTGTPEGVGKVSKGDRLKAFIGSDCLLDFQIK